uniref:Doublecortin domain-containing protein n=1 Tax=Heterorhabditis bacteriophora TaxID=37862 RepID=A0A1I7WKL1_HETBA
MNKILLTVISISRKIILRFASAEKLIFFNFQLSSKKKVLRLHQFLFLNTYNFIILHYKYYSSKTSCHSKLSNNEENYYLIRVRGRILNNFDFKNVLRPNNYLKENPIISISKIPKLLTTINRNKQVLLFYSNRHRVYIRLKLLTKLFHIRSNFTFTENYQNICNLY